MSKTDIKKMLDKIAAECEKRKWPCKISILQTGEVHKIEIGMKPKRGGTVEVVFYRTENVPVALKFIRSTPIVNRTKTKPEKRKWKPKVDKGQQRSLFK